MDFRLVSYSHNHICGNIFREGLVHGGSWGFMDEVVGHILSFLTTKCGVSTSILSTKWRSFFYVDKQSLV